MYKIRKRLSLPPKIDIKQEKACSLMKKALSENTHNKCKWKTQIDKRTGNKKMVKASNIYGLSSVIVANLKKKILKQVIAKLPFRKCLVLNSK